MRTKSTLATQERLSTWMTTVAREATSEAVLRGLWRLAVAYAGLQALILLALFVNHAGSPEITRGAMYESAYRLSQGLPIYPAPSPRFVGVAYMPMFSVIGALAIRMVGETSAALRSAAILGSLGAWVMILLISYRMTRSGRFAAIAGGLFAAMYFTFDAYYDYGNPDSWMLFLVLLGLYLCSDVSHPLKPIAGVLSLTGAFWFKQQGAVLLIAGLLYLTYRKGIRGATGYWILAAAVGPGAYMILGPKLFGQEMLYYTFLVPSEWTQVTTAALWRYLYFILDHFAYLAHIAAIWVVYRLLKGKIDVWDFTLPFAVSVGVLGVLESGSESNVFLVPGVWFVLLGVAGVWGLAEGGLPILDARSKTKQLVAIGLVVGSFGLSFYNPLRAVTPRSAWDSYRDLVQTIQGLDGIVYLPDVGQLQDRYRLPVPVHYVHLDDLVSEQTQDESNRALVSTVLAPLKDPTQDAYILSSVALENYVLLSDISERYVLVEDFGDKWSDLRALPGRFSGYSWPRYLYANVGNQ